MFSEWKWDSHLGQAVKPTLINSRSGSIVAMCCSTGPSQVCTGVSAMTSLFKLVSFRSARGSYWNLAPVIFNK